MKTLEEAFRGSSQSTPYASAIKVNVCGVGPVISYKNAGGEKRQSTVIGFADNTMAVKGVLYDSAKLHLMKEGQTVMLLNVILKNDVGKSIVMTNRSKVLKTGPMEVPASLIQRGKDIACPPPAAEVNIKTVQTSPVKTLVTLRGQVVSEEIERSVRVNGEDTPVRTIKVKDASGSCKVSLWRDLCKEKTSVGRHISITNVVVQLYNDEKSVSTTSRTNIEEVDTPVIHRRVSFIGFEWLEENLASLTADDANGEYEEFKISSEALAHYLECQLHEVESVLLCKLPLTAEITARENEIIEIKN
ncbi:uncharacterized protein LOC128179831 [Crassostrea angulata]|uniref:uncharacterized protein LOC128179831 n=1 Tax=Magallana angulata TaxID=2784310 RepID=UPI0022B1AFD5|nr:uncharacterized protein LOC128179831 [Crassostrea angulata]